LPYISDQGIQTGALIEASSQAASIPFPELDALMATAPCASGQPTLPLLHTMGTAVMQGASPPASAGKRRGM